MYTIHIMNLKINIWTSNFFIQIWKLIYQFWKLFFFLNIRIWDFIFEFENSYFNCLQIYLNFKFLIWIWYFQFKFKRLFDLKKWYLNFKLIFLNQKISISIQKIINWLSNGHFNFEYFNMNIKIYISTLKILHLNFK